MTLRVTLFSVIPFSDSPSLAQSTVPLCERSIFPGGCPSPGGPFPFTGPDPRPLLLLLQPLPPQPVSLQPVCLLCNHTAQAQASPGVLPWTLSPASSAFQPPGASPKGSSALPCFPSPPEVCPPPASSPFLHLSKCATSCGPIWWKLPGPSSQGPGGCFAPCYPDIHPPPPPQPPLPGLGLAQCCL